MRFPAWMQWYKKPEYRDIKDYSTSVSAGKRPLSPDGRGKTCIPSKLKLERILENKTCSPMSLYDFYMYLKYIEFSSENLEFYLWFKSYERTWAKNGGIKEVADDSMREIREMASDSTLGKSSIAEPAKLEAGREILSKITQLITPSKACQPSKPSGCTLSDPATPLVPSSPLPVQSSELHAIINNYILPGSPKELNIPPSMRDTCLAALERSPSPSHLEPLAEHIYQLLRNCSHRNFVRLGVGNGTFETVCVATTVGFVLILAGILAVLLRAFTTPGRMGATSRWEVWAAWPMWWVGCSLVLSGLRGSCFFLLLFSRRQPLPWERFDDGASVTSSVNADKGLLGRVRRLMIFDRKLRVSDVDLRALQRKIVLQSLVGGAVFAFLGVGVFIFLPIWRETARV